MKTNIDPRRQKEEEKFTNPMEDNVCEVDANSACQQLSKNTTEFTRKQIRAKTAIKSIIKKLAAVRRYF
jgi:hypothetical protein